MILGTHWHAKSRKDGRSLARSHGCYCVKACKKKLAINWSGHTLGFSSYNLFRLWNVRFCLDKVLTAVKFLDLSCTVDVSALDCCICHNGKRSVHQARLASWKRMAVRWDIYSFLAIASRASLKQSTDQNFTRKKLRKRILKWPVVLSDVSYHFEITNWRQVNGMKRA